MSTTIMSACWPLVMSAPQKAVLISLADNANDAGECWPSIDTIATRTCLNRVSVIRAIKALEAAGHLVADRSNGRHSRYTLTPNLGLFDQLQAATKPVAQSNRLHKVTGCRELPDQLQAATKPVAQSNTNHQEPSRTVSKSLERAARAQHDLSRWPQQPHPDVWADWLTLRKAKRAPVTPTVIASMARELTQAVAQGYTVDDCLRTCVMQGWQGFHAAWLARLRETRNGPVSAVDRVRAATAAKLAREEAPNAIPYLG
ncbi:MAG TPA: helix-turn-helix domain-containing protein [Burkholderiales bacterium]|nr:helix-turn-helix domain-containing protein [Burkholderiales bacterium]